MTNVQKKGPHHEFLLPEKGDGFQIWFLSRKMISTDKTAKTLKMQILAKTYNKIPLSPIPRGNTYLPSAWTQSGRCLGQCSKCGIQSAVESRRSEVKVSLRYILKPAAESANLVTAPELPMAAPTNNA